jgi:hypothetical protein
MVPTSDVPLGLVVLIAAAIACNILLSMTCPELGLLLNGTLSEGYKVRKPAFHLGLRAFEFYTISHVAEFIAQPGVNRFVDLLTDAVWASFALYRWLRCFRNAGILTLNERVDISLVVIVQHQEDLVEVHEFLHGAQGLTRSTEKLIVPLAW